MAREVEVEPVDRRRDGREEGRKEGNFEGRKE